MTALTGYVESLIVTELSHSLSGDIHTVLEF